MDHHMVVRIKIKTKKLNKTTQNNPRWLLALLYLLQK